MADLVTVTIDERTVQVPKGTGMVETAAAAGIEIPVFCYEPRLGAPVGACRMCLVEVEGMPKLQAGCTLSAQDGMIVHTARSSEKAAEGQHSTLEFILVNHPLDCPVCDKGGECPLQDLTFRYGPGNTRMTFPKRTFEKPIPISPLIALDRERCILCYRCTRFSESVAEDGQLVAINRGAQSVIATFEDEPYRGHFSGNVTELCPVGALTATSYRFEARPWEIQSVPTVCGLCPVGCNISATTREGKVKRILSRNHPEVDEGWLCDKGRFAFAHLDAADRITAPLRKAGPRRFEQLSWEDALDAVESALRAGGESTLTALSGGETVEEAYALAKLLRRGLGANLAVLPEPIPDGLDSYRAPLSALRDAKTIAVISDDAGRRARACRRALAESCAPCRRDDPVRRARGPRRRARHRPRGDRRDGARGERHFSAADAERPRRHRRVERGRRRRADRREAAAARPLRRRSGARPERARPRRRGGRRDRDRDVREQLPRRRRPRPPRHELPRARRHDRQPRGPPAAPAPRRARSRARTCSRGSRSSASASTSRSRRTPPSSSTRSRRSCFGGISFGDVGGAAPPAAARGAARNARHQIRAANRSSRSGPQLRLTRYRPLFSGPAVERTPELQFQRARRRAPALTRGRARARRSATARPSRSRSNGTSVELRARSRARPGGRHRPRRRGRRRRPARPRRGDAVSAKRGGSRSRRRSS